MENYKKAYALLAGKVDKALTVMDTGNLLEFEQVRDTLLKALRDAEEIFIGDEAY